MLHGAGCPPASAKIIKPGVKKYLTIIKLIVLLN
jgi:hypothetical protein